MLAGHFTTALIAKQHAPKGHLAYYLVASQLPDFLWLMFDRMGLEPTEPTNLMATSLDSIEVDMTYSHDLLPMFGWIGLIILIGRALFGRWRPGLVGGLLVVVHAATDYVGGFPHNVFGPDSHSVGLGLYASAPYVAVALEALFTVVAMAWVFRVDARDGITLDRATKFVWLMVFGGGLAFMALSADLSLAEVLDTEPSAALDGTAPYVLLATYASMLGALIWTSRRWRAPAHETQHRLR